MKTSVRLFLLSLVLLSASCSLFIFTPQVGKTKEKSWLRHSVAADLVYVEGDIRAYRSGGAYYYFKTGTLIKVGQSLVSADKVAPAQP